MHKFEQLYINGTWLSPEGEGSFDVYHAATEEVLGQVPAANGDDVDKAVKAALAADYGWSGNAREVRAEFLQKLQAGLAARAEELVPLLSAETGMPPKLAQMIQFGLPMATLANCIELATGYPLEQEVGNSLVVKEPVGVVGCITPWNFPLHQVMAKVAPALAAGCTVVLKPSEVNPLSAFILAEVCDEIGLPPGVFNLVSGDGPTVGEAIASHPDVAMVSFTGSTRAGRRVAALASQTIKRVALELGGKSPNLILDDADLEAAVKWGVRTCCLNSGQMCSAPTRMLVHESQLDEAIGLAKAAMESFVLGYPGGTLGPLVSSEHRERVRSYIRKGIEEGAPLITGGPEQPEGLDKGYFVKPTLFAPVDNQMTIAREEIFGPVLCILPYKDEEQAVAIANDTPFGLAGAVWSGEAERAARVARRLRAGQVHINGGEFNPFAPFGGYKQSGVGRELGEFGFEEFFEIKAMHR